MEAVEDKMSKRVGNVRKWLPSRNVIDKLEVRSKQGRFLKGKQIGTELGNVGD